MSTATLSPAHKPKIKTAAKYYRTASVGTGPFDSLMVDFQSATVTAANPIIQKIAQGTTWLPVSTDSLGPIHFYFQNGSFFNAYTWNYINNLFAYNQNNNNYYTNGDGLNTALYNVFSAISYVLSPADQATVNTAYLNNIGDMATLVTNFTAGGYATVPTGQTQAQYNFVLQFILNWSIPSGSTMPPVSYTAFFESPNPAKLLPYAPAGATQLVKQLIAIVNKMGPANAIIGAQQAVVSEVTNVLANIQGPVNYSTTTTPPAGWMALADDNGPLSSCEPQWILNPNPQTITSQLEAGSSFTVSMSVIDINNSSCNVSVNDGGGVSVGVGFFGISGSASASYDLSTMCENITQLDVTMTFNGVTSISMVPSGYNVSTSAGWWLPSILSQAVNYDSAVSGPFIPPSAYNFHENGNFGVLNNLFISQLPEMSLTFNTVNADQINQIFTTTTSWGVDFLGIDLGGGSSTSTYTSNISNYSSTSITITMAPPPFPSSLPPNDQTAFVIGGSLTWPGAK